MERLFKINGTDCFPTDLHSCVNKIAKSITEKIEASVAAGMPRKQFDCFLNYRRDTEGVIAETLYFALKAEGLNPFLDKMCLKNEDWKDGFLRGLANSSVFVALISVDGLAPVRDVNKDHSKDNVLLEYQMALDINDARRNAGKPEFIVPVLIAKDAGGGLFPFRDFSASLYSNKINGVNVQTINRTKAVPVVERENEFVYDSTSYHQNNLVPRVIGAVNAWKTAYKCSPQLKMALQIVDRAWFASNFVGGCYQEGSTTSTSFQAKWNHIKSLDDPSTLKYYMTNPAKLGHGVNMSAPSVHFFAMFALESNLKMKNIRVLDIGCGTGYTSVLLAMCCRKLGGTLQEVIGVDHVQHFIEGARTIKGIIFSEKLQGLAESIRFIRGDARDLNTDRDGAFDVIHTGAAVPTEQVEAFQGMLKVGGSLVGPVQESAMKQAMVKYTRTKSGIEREELLGVRYTKLCDLDVQEKQ